MGGGGTFISVFEGGCWEYLSHPSPIVAWYESADFGSPSLCCAQGTVIIVANEGSVIMIPDGTVLRDSVITGNLRILDH